MPNPGISRRDAVTGLWSLAIAAALPIDIHAATPGGDGVKADLATLEDKAGGKLGVTILNTRTGAIVSHRGDQRFGMCSSFKLALAGLILRAGDDGTLAMDTFVPLTEADRVYFAPVAGPRIAMGGMSIGAMARAAQITSDNVATNKLLGLLGGPSGFTAALRRLGDDVTRLDRLEPDMMQVPVGDPRDTTTPMAMARTVGRMLTTDYLSDGARQTLIGWMEATTTGAKRLRAGLPATWRSGDKTGTGLAPGMPDRYNDIAITWPAEGPHRGVPYIIAAYYESPVKSPDMRDEDQAVLARVGAIAAEAALAGSI